MRKIIATLAIVTAMFGFTANTAFAGGGKNFVLSPCSGNSQGPFLRDDLMRVSHVYDLNDRQYLPDDNNVPLGHRIRLTIKLCNPYPTPMWFSGVMQFGGRDFYGNTSQFLGPNEYTVYMTSSVKLGNGGYFLDQQEELMIFPYVTIPGNSYVFLRFEGTARAAEGCAHLLTVKMITSVQMPSDEQYFNYGSCINIAS